MSFFWQIFCAVVLWKGMENAGVLDAFPIYHTEVTEQKIRSPAVDELLRFRQCLFTAHRFGQSLSGGVVDSEQDEQQQIVADHAPPSADQPHPQQAGTQERTENADAPHSGDVEQKRNCGFSDSLHQLLQHGGLGQRENDAQYRGIQPLFTHDFSFCFHSMLFIRYTENDSQLLEGSASKPPASAGGFGCFAGL